MSSADRAPTAAVLAVNNFGDTRSGGLAGPLALLIIALLAIATVLLIRNMNARLRRLPDRFPAQSDATGPGAGRGAGGGAGADRVNSGEGGAGSATSGEPPPAG